MKAHFFAGDRSVHAVLGAIGLPRFVQITSKSEGCYSLSARIVETAPTGTTLHVVGQTTDGCRSTETESKSGWQNGSATPALTLAARRHRRQAQQRRLTTAVSLIGNALAIRSGQTAIGRFRTDNAPRLHNLSPAPLRSRRVSRRVKLTIAVTLIGNAIATRNG